MPRQRTTRNLEANDRVADARKTGAAAALVGVATAELVGALTGGPRSVLAAIADRIIDATPAVVMRWAIAWFGSANRVALLTAMALVVVGIGATAGQLRDRHRWVPWVTFACIAAATSMVLAGDALLPTVTAVVAPLSAATLGLATLHWLDRRRPSFAGAPGRQPDRHRTALGNSEFDPDLLSTPTSGLRSRRTFLTAVAGSVAAAGLATVGAQRINAGKALALRRDGIALPRPTAPLPPPAPSTRFAVDGLSPILTPTEEFFRIDARLNPLQLDASDHIVRIRGMVDRPYELTYQELLDLAVVEADVTLCCVSNEVGGPLIGTARWQGVPLTDVLDRAGVQEGADQVVGRAVDTWTAGFPLEAANDGRVALLAIGMNGQPLPARHGFPVRLVVEGLYGYVCNTKWLAEIELTTFADYQAYWIRQGWATHGPIKTQSRIDVPTDRASVPLGPVDIAGVAWSNEHGIAGVEVRIDGGRWQTAEVTQPLANGTWLQWRYRWEATEGRHELQVRAIDASGAPQDEIRRPPEPDGATGYHTISVVARPSVWTNVDPR